MTETMNRLWDRYRRRGGCVAEKTLDNVDIDAVKQAVPDVKVVGDGNLFQLLCKASSKKEGWMKSTKAMQISEIGCVVQVTTQQNGQIAEAVTFVAGVRIVEDINGGRKLIPNYQ